MSIDIEKLEDAVQMALAFFVHYDKMNAAVHGAPVRFSPITFRLAESVPDLAESNDDIDEVLRHRGQYAEDAGR